MHHDGWRLKLMAHGREGTMVSRILLTVMALMGPEVVAASAPAPVVLRDRHRVDAGPYIELWTGQDEVYHRGDRARVYPRAWHGWLDLACPSGPGAAKYRCYEQGDTRGVRVGVVASSGRRTVSVATGPTRSKILYACGALLLRHDVPYGVPPPLFPSTGRRRA